MDNKSIRHKNLLTLIDIAGSLKNLERRTDVSANLISQLKNKTRGIGDNIARRLEVGMLKPHGWMDVNHSLPQGVGEQMPEYPPAEQLPEWAQRVLKLMAKAGDAERETAIAVLETMLKEDRDRQQR